MAEWEQLTDVERTCLGVAFSRWHSSSHGTMPCTWPDGQPWYSDPLGHKVVARIPLFKQQELEEVRLKGDSWMRLFCAVRTTEIDYQIQEALKDPTSGIQQMVLIGAGMDTRAWRLTWPPGFSVFEVDSQQVLDFKHEVLSQHDESTHAEAGTDKPAGTDGNLKLPQTSCAKRAAIAADASKAADLWRSLLSAGLSAAIPTVFVLEGFIGYLTREAGNTLLHQLATHSAPGSRIIMTAPPSQKERDQRAAQLDAAAAEAAAAAADGTAADGRVIKPYRPKLHHSTFEESTETLARLSAAGWSDCKLLTAEELGAKYGVPRAQAILLGKVV